MRTLALIALASLPACARLGQVGQQPDFTPPPRAEFQEAVGYELPLMDVKAEDGTETLASASLWTGERGSLLGDRRAMRRGDILTVVIEIDDSAEISNSSSRSRSGSESMSVPHLLGIPQRLNERAPDGATMSNAVSLTSSSASDGDGSVSRNEQLELRIAATITEVMPNGVLRIQGSQEVRVNHELRELLVSGFVRPADITRQNEISYDKIASARISYGGRGQISDVQQPRYGQQVADVLLPF